MDDALAGLQAGDPVQVLDDYLAAGSPGWAGHVVQVLPGHPGALEVSYAGGSEVFALPDGRSGNRFLRVTGEG